MTTQKTVTEILASGMTQARLALLVPCSHSLIAKIVIGLRGENISKKIGDRLEAIHAEVLPAKVAA